MKTHVSIRWALCLLLFVFFTACEEETPSPECDGSLTVVVSASQNADCESTAGSLTVTATGGNGDFEFKLDQGDFQAANTFMDLAPGAYTVTVRDGDGCTAEVSGQVLSGLRLTNIQPIIETNCAISNCHDGSNNRPDFTVASNIISGAAGIKTRTGNGTMPPANSGVSLTAAQVALIACWVDDGAPQ